MKRERQDTHENYEAERHGGGLRHYEDHCRHHQGQQHRWRGRADDACPDPAYRGVCGAQLPEDEPLPLRGGDSGSGGVPDHGPRRLRGRQELHHLPLCPLSGSKEQHHRREDPQSHRVLQRGGQAGELQQEPGGELHPAGLHGRGGLPGPQRAAAAPRRHRGGSPGGHHPLPRLRLLRPAHAQLRSGEPGGHAAKRHRHHRHSHRAAPQLLHRLQHRHPDHRPGGLQPVRRPVHLPGPSGPLCGREPEKDPPAGGAGDGGPGHPAHPGEDRGAGGDPAAGRGAPGRPDHPVPGADPADHQRPGPLCHGVHVPGARA